MSNSEFEAFYVNRLLMAQMTKDNWQVIILTYQYWTHSIIKPEGQIFDNSK